MINNVVFRFIVVGGSVAVLQLLMLYGLHGILGISSIYASIISFTISVFINFGFQKFWSFKDLTRDTMTTQFGFFFTNALVNLMCNALLMSLWINVLSLNTYISQAITLALIAVINFFVYRLIFSYRKKHI